MSITSPSTSLYVFLIVTFPCRNHEVLQEKSLHVTRFISLSKVNNPKKLKWLYAFNIAPMATMPAQKLNEQPAGTTPCPYDVDLVEQEEKSEARRDALGNQYFYDVSDDVMAGNTRGTKRRHPDNNRRQQRPPPKPMGSLRLFLTTLCLMMTNGWNFFFQVPAGFAYPVPKWKSIWSSAWGNT